MQLTREKILKLGGTYIAGIFMAYFLIGLGILKVLHIFNTPHFMGKLGATLLITFGVLNLLSRFFPAFPIKLKIPGVAHGAANLWNKEVTMFYFTDSYFDATDEHRLPYDLFGENFWTLKKD